MTTLKSITHGFSLLDAAGRIKEISATVREGYAEAGGDADSLIGRLWQEIFPGAGEHPAGRALQQTLAGRLPTEAEFFHPPLQRWYAVHHYPTSDGGVATFLQDITERKDAVRRNDQFLQNLLDHAPNGFYIVDADLVISHLNADSQARAFHNINPAIGRRLEEAMHIIWPEPLAREIMQIFRHTLATGEPYHSPGLVSQRADVAEVESYEWQLERIVMPDGRYAVVCYYYDTTALRKAELALRKSHERFDILRDGAQVGFWFCDLPFDKLVWDDRVKEHFWLAPETEVTIDTFYNCIHPDDRERTQAAIALSVAEHTRYDIEYRTVSPVDAQEKWIRAIGRTFYDAEGQAIRFDGVTLDITEKKRVEESLRESEEVLRSVSTDARAGLVMLNEEGRYLFANQTYADFFGLPNADLIGLLLKDVLAHVYEEQIRPHFARAIAGERLNYELHVPAHGRLAEERFYDVNYEPRTNQRGRYVVVVIMDITERKKRQQILEQTVEKRTAQLRETVSELEGFTYSITHDLRAPLRAVNSFSQILEEDYGDKLDLTGQRFLQKIQQAVTRMDKLIVDVLQYSHILRADLKLEPVDTDKLVREMIESYPDFQEPKATIHLPDPLPRVLANEAALTQCFSNLLYNAVKFVPPGQRPRIIIRAVPGTATVRFWIEDNGIGIEPKYLANIFVLFHRLSHDYEGTGVGLSIVHKAIERMGGTLGVESEPGQGSRFWFELKAAANEQKLT